MKCLVKPTSNIMLILDHHEIVHPDRPSVVTASNFVSGRVASGVLKLVESGLPDTATDEQFSSYWRECRPDEALAIASFLATFKPASPVESGVDPNKADPSDEEAKIDSPLIEELKPSAPAQVVTPSKRRK